jgi:hypothetical protein
MAQLSIRSANSRISFGRLKADPAGELIIIGTEPKSLSMMKLSPHIHLSNPEATEHRIDVGRCRIPILNS